MSFPYPHKNGASDHYNWSFPSAANVKVESDHQLETIVKMEDVEQVNAIDLDTTLSDSGDNLTSNGPLTNPEQKATIFDIPRMPHCQNCGIHFFTEYQYEKHLCEINAENTISKENADVGTKDKIKTKYDYPTCGNQYVHQKTLENHQAIHDSTLEKVCKRCDKKFLSDNQLRIHIEKYCKKADDTLPQIPKVTLMCIKCGMQYIQKNKNLKSHQDCVQKNVCEHCKYIFLSKDWLHVHEERYCRKIGDTIVLGGGVKLWLYIKYN